MCSARFALGPVTLLAVAVAVSAASSCARVSDGAAGGTGAATGGTFGAGTGGARDAGVDIIQGHATGDPEGGVCEQELVAIIRDFRSGESNGVAKSPDFEGNNIAVDPGIVAATLGADGKPVYAGGTKGTTTDKSHFDEWYHDVAGVNLHFEKKIPLAQAPNRPGVFVYDNDLFYPLANDEGFGDQYLGHNQDFTTEIHVSFPYKGGEEFTFFGDDDVFIFVNNQLVVDLGGLHDPLTGVIKMDEVASKLGLVVGGIYRMDIFHADRHCCNSRFHLETTLSCIVNVVIG